MISLLQLFLETKSDADIRVERIQKWLDEKVKNAPGDSIGEKQQWLWNNDSSYVRLLNIMSKHGWYKPFRHKNHPETEKSKHLSVKYYIRFGDIPKDGKSMNHFLKKKEKGISVYQAKWNNKHNMWELETEQLSEIGLTTLDSLVSDFLNGKGRPIYLINSPGTVETGINDDEPLINLDDVKIVKKLNPTEVWIEYYGGNEWSY